jgi:transposase-like protein
MKLIKTFNSFVTMIEVLNTEEKCRDFLENLRWGTEPICPHCGVQHTGHYKLKTKGEFRGWYKCRGCRQRFTVTVGTIFEGSHVSLRKWFIAIFIFTSHKKGISSYQLARDLGITQKSAWFMLGRIRSKLGHKQDITLIGTTQIDETFFGGKNKNRHWDKKVKNSQGRSFKDKTPVLGLLNDGQVYTKVIKDTSEAEISPVVLSMVEGDSTIVTDEWLAYSGAGSYYNHKIVYHNEGKYVDEEGNTTNAIEGYWSHFKRGMSGIYHKASRKHLQGYCDEFSYRYNTREQSDTSRFALSLENVDGRLTYKKFIGK